MTVNPAQRVSDIERTPWAIEFKADSPVSYAQALRYAQQEHLRVYINQNIDPGSLQHMQWAISVEDDVNFFMDVKPTKKEATLLCRTMGWTIGRGAW